MMMVQSSTSTSSISDLIAGHDGVPELLRHLRSRRPCIGIVAGSGHVVISDDEDSNHLHTESVNACFGEWRVSEDRYN